MTGFRASCAITALFLGLGAAIPVQAQEDAADRPSADSGDPTAATGDATDSGQDRDIDESDPVAPDPEPARRPPRSILPGPYLPAGSIIAPDLTTPSAGAESRPTGPEAGATPGAGANDAADLSGPVGVDSLSALGPSAIGAWTDADPPSLPVDMWRGSKPAILTALLPVLRVDFASPTLKSLARRLLLSPAQPPLASGIAANVAPDSVARDTDAMQDDQALEPVGGEMLRLRLARLYAGGALDDFLALAEQSPERILDETTRRMQAGALMLVGDYDAACRIAGDAIGLSGTDFWQRAMVICAAFNGDRSQVYFRLGLLNETGAVEPAFESMALALLREIEGASQTGTASIPALPARLDALTFSLARLSRTPVPADLAAAAAPAVLSAALDLPDYGPEERLVLIAPALDHGLIEAGDLSDALTALSDNAPAEDPSGSRDDEASVESDMTGAPAADPRLDGLKALGRAYRAALDAADPRAVLEALDRAYGAARALGHPVIGARLLAGPLGRVSVAPELADRAHVAGRLFVLSGETAAARRWYEAARTVAQAGNTAAEHAMRALWPLLAMAEDDPNRTPDMVRLWWQDQIGDDAASRKAATLAALLQVFDTAPPAMLLQAALTASPEDATAPSAALWRQLLLAIHGGRTGETVLTSLAGLRNGGVAHTTEGYLAAVMAGLRRAGLTDEARALALERLAHTGF